MNEIEDEVEDEVEDEAENKDIVLSVDLKVVEQGKRIPLHWIFHRSGPLKLAGCWKR